MDRAVSVSALDAPIAALGESPVWSVAEQALYWVDIDSQQIHRYDFETANIESRTTVARPGSIALNPVERMLTIGMEHHVVRFDWDSADAWMLLDLEAEGIGNRLNDGRCDPAGRYVLGSMFADTNAGRTTGILHQVQHGSATQLRSGIGVANGLAFDAVRNRMYFADTPTEKVLAFDYDPATGIATNERVFFDYADMPGKPDGACVDSEGCYWSASVNGWAVLCISPDGEVVRRVELPLQKPSMPCFGGPNLDVLFVTTIGVGGNTPSEPGKDGFAPGATLRIDGLGVTRVREPTYQG